MVEKTASSMKDLAISILGLIIATILAVLALGIANCGVGVFGARCQAFGFNISNFKQSARVKRFKTVPLQDVVLTFKFSLQNLFGYV